MLVLWRKNGQYLTITNRKNGEQVRIKVYGMQVGRVALGLIDDANNYAIERDERYINCDSPDKATPQQQKAIGHDDAQRAGEPQC